MRFRASVASSLAFGDSSLFQYLLLFWTLSLLPGMFFSAYLLSPGPLGPILGLSSLSFALVCEGSSCPQLQLLILIQTVLLSTSLVQSTAS